MGRRISFVLDDKSVDVERHQHQHEALLDLQHDSTFAGKDRSSSSVQKASSSPVRGSLTWLKDVLKLLLFCAVTVAGMTLIAQSFPQLSWFFKPESAHDSYGIMPSSMDACPSSFHNTTLAMDFTDPNRFAFTQKSQGTANQIQRTSGSVKIIGSVEVRNTVRLTGSYVHVDLDIRGSDPQLNSALAVAKTDASLVIKTPEKLATNRVSVGAVQVPCLYISAVITINTGAKLQKLGITTESLAVLFRPGLDYSESRVVGTKTQFDSKSSYSRDTIIDVASASVTGTFPLYDLLSIHTNTGSISVDVVPKNASRVTVKPAALRLSSNSGSVRNTIPTSSVPDRDYQTSISTSSGSIDAVILHGLRTSLRSINGRISAQLYPYGHNNSRSDIEVHSTSGNKDIRIRPSISHPLDPLRKLYGYYRGVSGSLNLFYPAQWQGSIDGTTSTGSINLNWQGLKVVKDGSDGSAKRRVQAVRGKGEGRLEFHETSGSFRLAGESGGV
ncbi:hypothetical protein ACLMJK_008949 [Lecanora helva]